MTTQEQIDTLKGVIAQCAVDLEDLTARIGALATILAKLEERLDKLERTQGDELTGSFGGFEGLDDVTLRVKVQTPQEHAWIKRQRWGKATQTPVPLWTTGGRNGDGSA
jgi:hypothetical protein